MPSQVAQAFSNASDEPNHASFTLEACRLTLGTTLPIAGKFICPDAMYTTGNLGKSWNELDLVPHRLTTTLGDQSDADTDYKVTLAADGITNGKVGYDVLSQLVLNAAKSHASCSVSSSATETKGSDADPFGGGTDTVIYRDASIHQNKGTVCVFDWYQRLALTSHLYSGSSLQSYMFQQANLSGSKKTLSIPVNQIEPQSIAKDMSASQTQDYAWDITKSATPNAHHFADSCLPSDRVSPSIAVTVSWDRLPANPGAITIITHVTATNPSARSITTTVTDRIYKGSTQANEVTPTESAGSPTHLTNTVAVPAFSTVTIIDFVGTVPAGTASSFNDVATASYIDEVTGVPIPQTIQATASAIASVNTEIGTNATAVVVDTESVSSGFHFAVNSTTGAAGSFGGYTLGTSTTGPVVWTSGVLTGDGSVTFNKTITADAPSVVTADDDKALSDTASLTGIGGFAASASASVALTSSAMLTVGVDKDMQGDVTGTQTFKFDVSRGENELGTITIPITPPAASASGSIKVAATSNSNTFTVHEQAADNWASQSDETVQVNLPNCAGAAEFSNTFDTATAKVKKATVPAGSESGWTFTLNGPGTPSGGEHVTTTGAGYANFSTELEQGEYTISETAKSGFDFTSKSGDCSFTVVYPGDAGNEFACTYTNTERGSLEVTKTVDWNGVTPDASQTFAICITGPSHPEPNCKNADHDGGKLTWDNLVHGDYVVSENDPGSSWVVSGGNGATATVHSGDTTTAAGITNTRKLGSLQITKTVNWSGVTPNSGQTFEICISGPSFPNDASCKTADFDGSVLTWNNLIPGAYAITENGLSTSWFQTGDTSATVPTNGGTATASVVNTRKVGSLQIVKTVDWNGITPNESQTFEICITGPSFPSEASCKTADFDGSVLTWNNLIPGAYAITEDGLTTAWIQSGDTSATVPSDGGTANAEVTNTRKLGALAVTKAVDWNGVTPVAGQQFSICITGASYPDGDCKPFTAPDDLVHTWTELIPGAYAISENGLTTSWIQSGDTSATVPTNGGTAAATVSNTRKLGSLEVTKAVDWNGVTPVEGEEFSICITGPSFTDADCKTFTSPDGLVQTWTDLIPGAYAITEDGLSTAWTQSGDTSATVPTDGGEATAEVTNTRKLGSLNVTKVVNWNGLTPDEEQEFEICITGPSYPEGDCKTVDFDGGTLTWSDLIPGNYSAGEENPGSVWIVTESVTGNVTVPDDGGLADVVPVITNTLRLGSLEVTKIVDWNNTPVVDGQTFEICVTGKSHPAPTLANGGCLTVGSAGGKLTWVGLIPGVYAVSEVDPGNSWKAVVADDKVLVPSGGKGIATVTNTHLPAEALGEQLARTGGEDTAPLGLASLVILLAAARRLRRRHG